MNVQQKNNLIFYCTKCVNCEIKNSTLKLYGAKVSACEKCLPNTEKYDLIEIIDYFNKEKATMQEFKRRGKHPEVSKAKIIRVFELYDKGQKINAIARETGLSWRTVKNIVNLSFVNGNDRIEKIRNEMQNGNRKSSALII